MSESNHIPAARQHLAAARAELYQHANGAGGHAPPALTRAAEYADAALGELDTYGVDVRPPVPEDFTRQ